MNVSRVDFSWVVKSKSGRHYYFDVFYSLELHNSILTPGSQTLLLYTALNSIYTM